MRTITSKTLAVALLLSTATAFTGCSTVEDGDFVTPISLTEKIGGKWVLNSVVQTDESNNKTKTLTDLLDFDTFVINLNQDAEGKATTFSVEGNAPELIPTSGNWQMDYDFTKSDNTANRIVLNPTGTPTYLTVTAVPGNTKTLEFRLTRRTNGQPFVSYTYNLMQAVK